MEWEKEKNQQLHRKVALITITDNKSSFNSLEQGLKRFPLRKAGWIRRIVQTGADPVGTYQWPKACLKTELNPIVLSPILIARRAIG